MLDDHQKPVHLSYWHKNGKIVLLLCGPTIHTSTTHTILFKEKYCTLIVFYVHFFHFDQVTLTVSTVKSVTLCCSTCHPLTVIRF